jgi:hypothetical protein
MVPLGDTKMIEVPRLSAATGSGSRRYLLWLRLTALMTG